MIDRACREFSLEPLNETLDAWRETANMLGDPLSAEALLGDSTDEDYVEAIGRAREGWSRVFHWRVPGSATRLDYVYRDDYVGQEGDPHPVVRIMAINFASH